MCPHKTKINRKRKPKNATYVFVSTMPPQLTTRKKKVSFGGASFKTIHLVENYRLTVSSPYQRNKVWYTPNELDRLARDNIIYQEQRDAALVKKANKAMCITKRKSISDSPIKCFPTGSPWSSNKELFDQKTQVLRELRTAASIQHLNNITHKQTNNKRKRAKTEALAATMLPSRRDLCQRRYYQLHTSGTMIGRVHKVFFSC